jgi:uncharacterized protein YndB with AHSA1/START domain
MTVVDVRKDLGAATITFVAEFAAPPDRVWQVWEDPRQLERWWGPPMWPATYTKHDFLVGGTSQYHMTGPDGTEAHGWLRYTAIDAPKSLELVDGFADETGRENPDLPTSDMRARFESADGGTRMTLVTAYPNAEALTTVLEMGMEEGMTAALGQIEAVLAG